MMYCTGTSPTSAIRPRLRSTNPVPCTVTSSAHDPSGAYASGGAKVIAVAVGSSIVTPSVRPRSRPLHDVEVVHEDVRRVVALHVEGDLSDLRQVDAGEAA